MVVSDGKYEDKEVSHEEENVGTYSGLESQ